MQTIYVIYKSNNYKTNKVKYDILEYQADTIIPVREGSQLHNQLLNIIGRSAKSRFFSVEFVYQNIEKSECIKYLEIRYNIKPDQLGIYIQMQ